MTALLTALVLLWKVIEPSLAVNSADFNVISMETDWNTAQKICLMNNKLLMPYLGLDILQSMISHKMQSEAVWWMNAKSVEIMYTSQPVYLKFAYQSGDVTSYLIDNVHFGVKLANISSESLSWKDAQKMCNRSHGCSLYNVSSPRQAKGSMSVLKEDVTLWLNKMSQQKIPNMVSADLNMKEDCIGVMKMADGSMTYRRDNCTNKHKFACLPSSEEFAPTVTKMSKPYLFVTEEAQPDYTTINGTIENLTVVKSPEEPGLNGAELGGIITGSVLGAILVAVAGTVFYFYRRWRSRRDYRRSLHRYAQRINSSRRILENTSDGSLPMNNSYSDNTGSVKMDELEGYEDCEKRPYAQCQKDVVQDLKSRYAKYPSKGAKLEHTKHSFPGSNSVHERYLPHDSSADHDRYLAQGSSAGQERNVFQGQSTEPADYPVTDSCTKLADLPGYHTMDGNKALQVLPAYITYDPDFGRLRQIHGYVNTENQPQLSDLDQYDNVLRPPEKTRRVTALDELDQYENHNAGNIKVTEKNVVGKPLGDTDRKTVSNLNDLEQYENCKLPKRQIGLFQKFKANKAKKEAEAARAKASASSDTLDDLEQYEKYEPPKRAQKNNVSKLDDLDAYENYVKKP